MDLKVNDAEWTALGQDEQSRIEQIVGGFFQNARIVPDAAVAKTTAQPQAAGLSFSNPFCKAACSVAQAAATAACAALVNPIAIAACVALAQAAGDECRKKC